MIKECVSFSCATTCALHAASKCSRALLRIKHVSTWRENEVVKQNIEGSGDCDGCYHRVSTDTGAVAVMVKELYH